MEVLKRIFLGDIKGIDEKERTLTAFVSTSTRDRMDESLDPMGADIKNYVKNPVVLWAHDYSMPPIGKALWTKRTKDGIVSKVQFAKTEFAEEIYQLYKDGFLKAFSVGFLPKEWKDGDGDKTPRRNYTKWEMLEYSAVPVPANPDALSLAISKGILKSDTIKKAIETELNDPEIEQYKEFMPLEELIDHEEQKSDCHDGADDLDITLYDDKISLLENTICDLKKENNELKYKIYQLMFREEKKSDPEITAGQLAKLINEAVSGVIRKHQGKLN